MWKIFLQGHILSMAGDALKDHRTIPKTLETLMNWSWHNKGSTMLAHVQPSCSCATLLPLAAHHARFYMSVSCLSLSIFQALGIASFLFLRTLGNDSYSFDLHHMLSSITTQDSRALPKYIIQNNVVGDEHVKPTTLVMIVEMACHQCMWSFTNTTQLVSVTAKRIPTSILSTKITNKPW